MISFIHNHHRHPFYKFLVTSSTELKKNVYQLEYFESAIAVKGATVRKESTLPTMLLSFLKRIFNEDIVGNIENDGFL